MKLPLEANHCHAPNPGRDLVPEAMMTSNERFARTPGQLLATQKYSRVAMIFHWLIAALFVAQIILGRTMTSLPPSLRQFELYQLHKSLGMTILALTLLRIGWRLTHTAPPLPAQMRNWERLAARIAHIALYVAMIAIPLLGWATVSTSSLNIPTLLWDVVPLPHLPLEQGRQQSNIWADRHKIAVWGASFLIMLHVAAALRHHLIIKDEVLLRMLPIIGQFSSRRGAQ